MDLTCSVQAGVAPVPLTQQRRRVLAWFVPDVAMLVSLLTVVWCLVFFDGTRQLFRDSDSGWHIRNGEAILDGNGLPRVDRWSLTRSGRPWFAWEWGADLLMGAAHRAGGLALVAGLYSVVLGACTWLWFRLHWAVGGNFLIACLFAIPLLTTANIHWHARPHVFGWLLFLATVVYFERKRRSLIAVAILGAIWANLHPSFFLLPAVALIYAFSRWIEPLIWSGSAEAGSWGRTPVLRPASTPAFVGCGEKPDVDVRRSSGELPHLIEARWYVSAAVVGLAATLLNPYGGRVHQHVFQYLTDNELLSRIGEFQTFNFHTDGAWQIVLTMGIAALGAAAALAARRPAHFLLIAMLLAMALRSARTLPLIAIVCLPLATGSLTWVLREWQELQPGLRKRIDAFLTYGANLRRLELDFDGLATAMTTVVAVALILQLPAVQVRAGFPSEVFPVKASVAVDKLPANARLLAPDMFGGYLIYRFSGQRKVFFDGRSDFYGVDYMKDYLRLIEVRPGWRDELAKTGFTHALLPNRYSLIPALEREGWHKLYSDDVATLLAAPPSN